MEIIDSGTAAQGNPIGREMTPIEIAISRVRYWLVRQRRKFPYLAWYDDEVDVTVTFSQDKLDPNDPIRSLYSGELYELEKSLSAMGIGFDKGIGGGGRDWEWDWSLKGPISVRFRSRAKKAHLRIARPRPCLVVSNQTN